MKFEIPRPQIPSCTWQRPIGLGWDRPYTASQNDDGAWHGMPLGGLGSGCIGRSHRGDFNLWHLDGGEHIFRSLPACQFSIYEEREGEQPQVYALSTQSPQDGSLSRWAWYPEGGGTYHALYPRSWFKYEGVFHSEILCEQFSPVWAGCYQESSYPVALFDWTVHNPTDRPIALSIMLTWQNLVGWFANAHKTQKNRQSGDRHPTSEYQPKWRESTGNFNQWIQDHHRVGCLFNRVRLYDELQSGEGQMAIASIINPAIEAFYTARWNPEGDGGEVWDYFAMNGSLPDMQNETPASPGEQIAAAMAFRFTIRPGRTRKIPFILAWDFPVIEFGADITYFRRHSDFFARTGKNAWTMVRTALKHGDVWKDKIETWQKPTLDRRDIPDWFKMALFNELYLLTDGGTLWTAATETDPLGQFALWESLDCRYYESLRQRLSGSFATLMLFPRLEKTVLEAFAKAIPIEDGEGENIRKIAGETPRDLGTSSEHPWMKTNANRHLDGQLSSLFIIQVYRNYLLSGATDTEFLWECWSAIAFTLAYAKKRGKEEEGKFWRLSLKAAIAIANVLLENPAANPNLQTPHYPEDLVNLRDTYQSWLQAIPILKEDNTGEAIAIEAIFEELYRQLLDLPSLGDRSLSETTLREFSQTYLLPFRERKLDLETGDNSQEIKLGMTFALATLLLLLGRKEESLQIAEILVKLIYNNGLQFRTPAILSPTGTFQKSHSLDGMTIWAMYGVLSQFS
ncbi:MULTISPECIES: GH116 family glycosyl-hydrolase [Spirulina sp. CCY15215]|uniref:GH116 family glycosyl-hydrolase n=1 Tax=Spirulina sp. CCY15215 TaxID=2767591 RepID=UPI00194E111C|nr:GH116 family glycosyl-hydrolase [Spirulina major]